MSRRGNQHFSKLAIIHDDSRAWVSTQRLSLAQEKLKWNIESAPQPEPAPEPRGENAFNAPAKIKAARRLDLGEAAFPMEEQPEYRKDYSTNGSTIRVEGQPPTPGPFPPTPTN